MSDRLVICSCHKSTHNTFPYITIDFIKFMPTIIVNFGDISTVGSEWNSL
jgi:hypothetical protein